MYAGRVVEQGRSRVFAEPLHPYTQALLAAVPGDDATPDGDPRQRAAAEQFPDGCRFHPRCLRATAVAAQPQVLREAEPGRLVACIHAVDRRRP